VCDARRPNVLSVERSLVLSDQNQLPAELLYEYTLKITQVVEYGASLETLMSGQAPPPAEGARFDIHMEGSATGTKLSGSIKAVDYLRIRPDGRGQINLHAEITTEDGKKIALAGDGLAFGEPPVLQLRETVTHTTAHPEYSWVNAIQVWATGTVDLTNGEIRIKAYVV
jgi:Protein of unknown function (DUF3237)